MSNSVLHIERVDWAGTFRLTVGKGMHERGVLEWLWEDPANPPAGTSLETENVAIGYWQFLLRGVQQEASMHLRPDAYAWLSAAEPESYRATQERLDDRARDWEQRIPWLGDLTVREIHSDTSQWGHRELDGHFVYVGGTSDFFTIERIPYFEDEELNRNLRWFIQQNPYDSLSHAYHQLDQFEAWKLHAMVLLLALR